MIKGPSRPSIAIQSERRIIVLQLGVCGRGDKISAVQKDLRLAMYQVYRYLAIQRLHLLFTGHSLTHDLSIVVAI